MTCGQRRGSNLEESVKSHQQILHVLQSNPNASTSEIEERTGLTRRTIEKHLRTYRGEEMIIRMPNREMKKRESYAENSDVKRIRLGVFFDDGIKNGWKKEILETKKVKGFGSRVKHILKVPGKPILMAKKKKGGILYSLTLS